MKILHPYLHEYDFPYHDFLLKFKKNIIAQYNENRFKIPNANDVQVYIQEIDDVLEPKIQEIITKHYFTTPSNFAGGFRAYIQSNRKFTSRWHNHMASKSYIQGVLYIDPPKEGGGFQILDQSANIGYTLQPQPNKLYLFPCWLYHRPLPQKDEKIRICLNWMHDSLARPIFKPDPKLLW